MRFQQVNTSETTYFILGNPNIPRLRERISKISKALDQLGIIRKFKVPVTTRILLKDCDKFWVVTDTDF